jgi:sugar-specific transcriptional regulator TrmB
MNKIQLSKSLQSLELSKTAIQVYMILLQTPDCSISEMCNQTGSYRRKIYESIDELKAIGLVERESDYSRSINIKSPSVVHTMLKNKQYEINKSIQIYEEMLPSLLTGFYEQGGGQTIRIFDSINKFIYLFVTILDEIEDTTDMISFNESDDLYAVLDHNYFFNVWIAKRIKKRVSNRILVNSQNSKKDTELATDPNKLREFRVLPQSIKEGGCYWVFGSKVIVWDTLSPKAIYIENQILATLLTNQFNLTWQSIPTQE